MFDVVLVFCLYVYVKKETLEENTQTVLHILFLEKEICNTGEEWKYLTINEILTDSLH